MPVCLEAAQLYETDESGETPPLSGGEEQPQRPNQPWARCSQGYVATFVVKPLRP